MSTLTADHATLYAEAPALPRDHREDIASRLVRAAAKRSFDPAVDIEWPQAIGDDRYFIPEHRVSLYGSALWERLTLEQRIALSRHEVASMAQAGVWFELILGQLLIRFVYDEDYTSQHTRWALTEIADECRHSSMFARLVDLLVDGRHRPEQRTIFLGRLLKTLADPVEGFADILIAEELLDRLQREMMVDDSLQPLTRDVARLHVIEEARHVKFARDELTRRAGRLTRRQRERVRMIVAISAAVVADALVVPSCYAAVGLDPVATKRIARANPVRRESLRWMAERLTAYFDDIGIIGNGAARRIWTRAGLLAA
ncbi:MAG: diiron oxygenase [Candidatus Dormibacteraeota bacterium]|nr:diiron oxygenase [Candidatus Dormibacteraeota bacterium]